MTQLAKSWLTFGFIGLVNVGCGAVWLAVGNTRLGVAVTVIGILFVAVWAVLARLTGPQPEGRGTDVTSRTDHSSV